MAIKRRNRPYGISVTDDEHLIFKAPTTSTPGSVIARGEVAFNLNETTNKLVVRARKTNGTLFCALISLATA
jgi:hypothetical protein